MALLPRLMCALLALLVALPAVQARACSPGADPSAGHHGGTAASDQAHRDHRADHAPAAPQPARADHDCIGCIAPIDIGAYRPAVDLHPTPGRATGPGFVAMAKGRQPVPEPPPPRSPV